MQVQGDSVERTRRRRWRRGGWRRRGLCRLGALAGAGERLPGRRFGAASALRGAFSRNDLGQRFDPIRVIEQLQDAVDLEPARRHPDVAFEFGPRELSRNLQPRPDADVAELVVDDFEVLRIEREVDGPDLPRVHGELAGDGELFAVLVEDFEAADPHDVRLQVDAGVESGVRRPEARHGERAVPDLDEPLEMGIPTGARDADVGFERATNRGHGRREALNDAEVERRRLQPEVDGVFGCPGDVLVRPFLKSACRQRAASSNRHSGRLLQCGVEGDAIARVVHVCDE